MAIMRSGQFHKKERGHGDEYWYSLCFDTDTGRFFVHEEASTSSGGVFSDTERDIEMADFMAGGGDRQNSLIELLRKVLR